MRNKIRTALMGILVFGIFTILLAIASIIETQYTREVTVVSYRADAVVVQDEQGFEWGFIGEGYELGEKLIVTFDNNHTSTRDDDRLIKVKEK